MENESQEFFELVKAVERLEARIDKVLAMKGTTEWQTGAEVAARCKLFREIQAILSGEK